MNLSPPTCAAALVVLAIWSASASAQTVTLNNGDTQDYTPVSAATGGSVDTRTFSGQATGETSEIDFDAIADSIGTSSGFSLTPAQLATTTGTQFLGQLEIVSGGEYTFNLTSDDGTRLFIDGKLVINNEGNKAPVLRTGAINLDAGLHEIRVDYVNNSGGGALTLEYSGNDQATMGAIPTSQLFRAENTVSTTTAPNTTVELGDNIILSSGASATINLNGTDYSNAGLNDLTVGTSSTLNITGTANRDLRFDTTTFSGASTYTINTLPDLSLGEVGGTAASTTIIKQGAGRLILDNTDTGTPNDFSGTTFDVQAGSLFVIGKQGGSNPLGTSSVQLNGGTLAFDTSVGDVSFDNAISLAGTGGTLKAVSGPRTFSLTDTTAINIGSGQTLTLETSNGSNVSDGSILVLTQALTGSGNLSKVNSPAGDGPDNGVAALTADSSSYSGQITVSGDTLEGRFGSTGSKVFGTGDIDLTGGTLSLQGANAGSNLNYTPGNDVTVTENSSIAVGAASGGGTGSDFALGTLTTIGARTTTIDSTANHSLTFSSTALGGNATFNVNSGTLSTGDITGTASNLTKAGAGTLALGSNSNLTGTIAINGGVLEASTISDSGPSSLGTAGVTLNSGTLRYTGSASTSTTRSFFANNLNGGSIDVSDAGATLEIDSGFRGNIGSDIVKLGAGTLALSGTADNNSMVLRASEGVTQLNKSAAGGTRAVAGITGIDSGAIVQLTGSSGDQIFGGGSSPGVNLSGGTLDLSEKSESINKLSGVGIVTNNGGSGTTSVLTVGEANASSSYSGAITDGASGGKVALVKTGSGVMTLTANPDQVASTFSGGTTINGGTLRLEAAPEAPTSGSELWLDAADADTLTFAGSVLSSWGDKSGNGRNATQNVNSERPTTVTNAQVGGLTVVSFDGANDHFDVDLTFLAGSDYTIFAVEGKLDAGATNYFLGTTGGGTNPNRSLHFGHRDNDTFTLAQFGNDINYTNAGNEYDGTNQEFNLWTAGLQSVADGSNDGMTIALDGVQVQQDAGRTTQMLNANNGRIGRGFGGTNQSYEGDLGEIIIYDRSLTTTERALVEGYLRSKWFGTSGSLTATNILPTDTDVNITASGATLDLNGVDQQIASLEGVAGSAVTMGSGDLIIDGSATTNFAGVISGSGSLTKAGSGTQTLSGDNTYSGATSVTGGILIVDGNQSTATGSVTVASGATLSGTGTIGGGTLIEGGATITAGTVGNTTFSNADLDFTGTLTVGDGAAATWLVDIVGGTGNDVVDIATTLTLANANLAITAGGTINVGDQFIIANYGSLSGTFSNASAGSQFTLGGQDWNIDYGSGTNGAITLTAVPEPTALIPLILLLLASLRFVHRRRNQASAQNS